MLGSTLFRYIVSHHVFLFLLIAAIGVYYAVHIAFYVLLLYFKIKFNKLTIKHFEYPEKLEWFEDYCTVSTKATGITQLTEKTRNEMKSCATRVVVVMVYDKITGSAVATSAGLRVQEAPAHVYRSMSLCILSEYRGLGLSRILNFVTLLAVHKKQNLFKLIFRPPLLVFSTNNTRIVRLASDYCHFSHLIANPNSLDPQVRLAIEGMFERLDRPAAWGEPLQNAAPFPLPEETRIPGFGPCDMTIGVMEMGLVTFLRFACENTLHMIRDGFSSRSRNQMQKSKECESEEATQL